MSSSSSATGLPPKVLDPSHASSSSSASDLENFNPNTASPAQKYRKFSERVNEIVSAEERSLNPDYRRPMIPRTDNIFAIAEDQPNPVVVGGGAALGTGTLAEVGRRALRAPLEAPPTYMAPPTFRSTATTPAIPSSSSTFISNYRSYALIGTVGILAAAATYKYQQFALGLRTSIENAFNDILNDAVTPQQLLDNVNEILDRIKASWFGRIFVKWNPIPIRYLILTRGIALDSIGINLDSQHNNEVLERLQRAQRQYQIALAYNIDDIQRCILTDRLDNIRDSQGNVLNDIPVNILNDIQDEILFNRICLAYARSLRLTNSPEAHILAQLDRILQHSPFHSVAEIERRALRGQPGEIMDRYQYPFEFLCPITQDIMVNPSYHTHEEHRYYFEGNAIQAWLVTHDTCPLSRRRPLSPEHLSLDEERRNIILAWSPTKLKQNIA